MCATTVRAEAPGVRGAQGKDGSAQGQVTPRVGRSDGEREFKFTSADFEKVRKLIYDHAGISLAPAKQDMVYSRLARRLRARGDATFADYLKRLEHDKAEWENFANSLTTNLTSFFREPHHFEVLAQELRNHRGAQPIKIWCAAASTGEEPYTLAITACEAFRTMDPPVRIMASDIDTNVLRQAEQGVFRQDRIDRMDPERVRRFFLKGSGAQGGQVKIRPELSRLVSFRQINLLDAKYPIQGPIDYIFCRNVMIYFDKPTQYAVLKRFAPLLKPDGLLFAGHSESFLHAADIFKSRGRTVYELTNATRR